MNTLTSIVLLLLILCLIIVLHEFGHFITAKKANVYVYEFSLGFGPRIFKFNRKNDETTYSIRCIPLGGYVSMAGETNTSEDDKKIKKDQRLVNKKFLPHLLVLLAGVIMNFILAFVILFVSALIYGAPNTSSIIGQIEENSPADKAGLKVNDRITSINGENIKSLEDLNLQLNIIEDYSKVELVIKRDNLYKKIIIEPEKREIDGEVTYHFGFASKAERYKGIGNSLKYATNKFGSMVSSMGDTIKYLFNGRVSVKQLSGPVGIYSVVDQAKGSFENILYLIAFLSVNVGVLNLFPLPVFDGGRALLLIIEKIKGSRLNPKVEEYLDLIGFGLMILLMIYVTINDIFKLF